MDALKKFAFAEAYFRCEKVAEVTWEACMKHREKPPTDPGCLHLKDLARITCVGEAKKKITSEYP